MIKLITNYFLPFCMLGYEPNWNHKITEEDQVSQFTI